jgi:cysteine-rich repeat protein
MIGSERCGLRADHHLADGEEEDVVSDLKKKKSKQKKETAAAVQALKSTAVCEDGVLDASEGCDDKNQISGDGCKGTCLRDCVGASDG